MKQTVSGNIKCFNISCSDEDVEKSIVNEIKLIKRKPTFEYILNDLAFENLKLKVIHGIASNQDKFDFDYQLKLKDKEIERLNNIINTFEEYLKNVKTNLRYIGVKWDDDCLIRAEVIQQVLHKLKELKESSNNE